MDSNNSLQSTIVPSPEPVGEQAVSLPQPQNKRILWVLLACVVVALGGLALLVNYLFLVPPTFTNRQGGVIAPEPSSTPTPSPLTEMEGDGLFLRANSVIRISKGNQPISYGSGKVSAFSYNPASMQLVTLEGEPEINSANYPIITPNTVVLYDLKNNSRNVLFEIPIRRKTQSDYVVMLRAVGFSPDGLTLAITSSDSVWIYDIKTKTSTLVYSTPLTDEQLSTGVINVWGYGGPRFSPDKTKLLLSILQYEGAQSAILDLGTKKLAELPYQVGNGGGTFVIDWTAPTELLVLDTRFDADSIVKRVRLSDFSETMLGNYTGSLHSPVLRGNSLFFIRQTLAPFNSIEVTEPGIEELIRLNLETNQSTVLLSRQRVEEKGWQELFTHSTSLFLREYSHTKIGEQFQQFSTIFLVNEKSQPVLLEQVNSGKEL